VTGRRSIRRLRTPVAALGIGLAVAFCLGHDVVPAHAASTSVWIQTLDSCKHTLGGSKFNVTDSSLSINLTVTTPSTGLTSVGSGGCPVQRGDCSSATNGCVLVTGLPPNDSFQIRQTATPPPNSGNPLGYAPCNAGSACRSETADFSIDGSGNVAASTTNADPDGSVVTYPNGGTFAGTASDPIVFHDFGLGSGSCDGDSDADDHLTGTASSHCQYLPESAEASACQPYPWSCTLPGGSSLRFVLSIPPAPSAGKAFSETVTAVDSHNNTATTYSGSKTLSWSGPSRSPNGSFPTYPANPVTFGNGVAKASITLVDAQTTSLTVNQAGISGTLAGLTVLGGVESTFTVTGAGAQLAGRPFSATVKALDRYGNVASYAGNKNLTWSGPSPSPTGTQPVFPPNPVSFTGGAATVSITLVDAQTTSLRVTDGVATGTSAAITVSAPNVNVKFVLATPQSPTAGVAFTETVKAMDNYGNPVTTYSGSKAIAWSGPSNSPNNTSPRYPSSVGFTNGAGAASITLVAAGTTTLTATQGGVTGTTAGFSVGPAAARHFSVANPGIQVAGKAFSEAVTAVDAYGNTASGYAGTPRFAGPSTSPSGAAPSFSPASVANGVATASITLFDAQSTVLTVSDGTLTGASPMFTVSAAAARAFSLRSPGTQTAGSTFAEAVTAIDAYGNAATSYAGTPSLTWSGPSSSPNNTAPVYPVSVSFTDGVATGSITLYDAQTAALRVSDGRVSGVSAAFTVNPANASTFALSAPSTATAGVGFTVGITAFDPYANVATGYTGSQGVSWSGPSASPGNHAPSFPASVAFAGGAGHASITLYDAQRTTLSASQGQITGTPLGMTVIAAPATAFILSNPGGQAAGSTFAERVTAVDPYGNTATGYGASSLTWTGPSRSPNNTAPVYPVSMSFTHGVGVGSITLYDAETTSLHVTDGTISGASAAFVVHSAPTSQLLVSLPSSSSYAPATIPPYATDRAVVRAEDAYGNAAGADSSALTVSTSDPMSNVQGSYPQSVTLSAGQASFSVTFYTPGPESVTVTGEGLSGTSNSTMVT